MTRSTMHLKILMNSLMNGSDWFLVGFGTELMSAGFW